MEAAKIKFHYVYIGVYVCAIIFLRKEAPRCSDCDKFATTSKTYVILFKAITMDSNLVRILLGTIPLPGSNPSGTFPFGLSEGVI